MSHMKGYPKDWQEIRRRIIKDRFELCSACGRKGRVVHHANGIKMDVSDINLVLLCRDCHNDYHAGRPNNVGGKRPKRWHKAKAKAMGERWQEVEAKELRAKTKALQAEVNAAKGRNDELRTAIFNIEGSMKDEGPQDQFFYDTVASAVAVAKLGSVQVALRPEVCRMLYSGQVGDRVTS